MSRFQNACDLVIRERRDPMEDRAGERGLNAHFDALVLDGGSVAESPFARPVF